MAGYPGSSVQLNVPITAPPPVLPGDDPAGADRGGSEGGGRDGCPAGSPGLIPGQSSSVQEHGRRPRKLPLILGQRSRASGLPGPSAPSAVAMPSGRGLAVTQPLGMPNDNGDRGHAEVSGIECVRIGNETSNRQWLRTIQTSTV